MVKTYTAQGTPRCHLADVFRTLNDLRASRVVGDYAIGGATAVPFYAEPGRTYDLNVFVKEANGIYAWAKAHGFALLEEHIVRSGVPVQFLPVHNALAGEAVAQACGLDYEGVTVRVIDPEHLVALALQTGGPRRRERAWQLLEAGQVDRQRLRDLLHQHGIVTEIPDDV